jgi:hypothetical protein
MVCEVLVYPLNYKSPGKNKSNGGFRSGRAAFGKVGGFDVLENRWHSEQRV